MGMILLASACSLARVAECQELIRAGNLQREDAAMDSPPLVIWEFGRHDDPGFRGVPHGWKRYEGIGFPKYVAIGIKAKDAEFERSLIRLDTSLIHCWNHIRQVCPSVPLPPSITDLLVDRYLRIDLDGGQAKYESPSVPANRAFQYRFSVSIMTQGLMHDSARAELVFRNDQGTELLVHSTSALGGTQDWTAMQLDLVRPPAGATKMLVRLLLERGEDGIEDIRGAAGFDRVRIERHPQLQIATDQPLGIYRTSDTIRATANITGLPAESPQVSFRLFDSDHIEIASEQLSVSSGQRKQELTGFRQAGTQPMTGALTLSSGVEDSASSLTSPSDSTVEWSVSGMEAGFYRMEASIVGGDAETLAASTTLAVLDDSLGGPPHGPFGWTLPNGSDGISQRELAAWLADLGVAWVKYPCWIAPDDSEAAERTTSVLGKLQEVGIQTVGLLDHPPPDQLSNYAADGRRDLSVANLFRDHATWQPLLEPVMTRLTLKVRTWQLGADRDYSFLGRSRLREAIDEIADGLQGFGQPIEVAISWPWLEPELSAGESSWQAVCRDSDPPMGARELDDCLSSRESEFRSEGPRTWLQLDPISKSQYDRDTRIRDLVLRMATVRGHSVQAAFVSDPRDPEHGLLRPDGRPDELLLPWRTTARLVGNLRRSGSLQLRSGANNLVFVSPDRAVLMMWAPQPTEESLYLGENIQVVDVWGRARELPNEIQGNQYVQRIPVGPIPTFVTGVDPLLLALRMSVQLAPAQLDSFLGEPQRLSISFGNPTQESLVGQVLLRSPETWSIDSPKQSFEMLAGQQTSLHFHVVLGNTSRIGSYELPIQFATDTVPPRVITVHKQVMVGPEGLALNVATRLDPNGDLRVQIEMTNHTEVGQSYECMLFPSAERQYQRCFISIPPGQTVRREVPWRNGDHLIGKQMLLRADQQNGLRVFNHSFEITR